MSIVFLLLPLDQLGFIEDPFFQVALATYWDHPCPLMAPLVGKYFGRDSQQLDKYGMNLVAAPLPGKAGWFFGKLFNIL